MTTLPGWTNDAVLVLLITLLSANSAFTQLCSCQTQFWGDCTSCYTGCYLYNTQCHQCPATCVSCTDWYHCNSCTEGYFGASCGYECKNCRGNKCYKNNGQCTEGCSDGFYPYITGECTNDCVSGYYQNGTRCLLKCQIDFCQICTLDNQFCSVCKDGYFISNGNCLKCHDRCVNGKCNKTDGSCTEGCIYGFAGRYCIDQCYSNCIACEQYNKETCTSCKPGYYGQECEFDCNTQCTEVAGVRQCAMTNGECTYGCLHGYTGSTCSDKCNPNCLSCDRNNQKSCDICNPGYHGQACHEECSSHCGEANNTRPCYKDTGKCLVNCTKGYRGPKCDVPCEAGCQDGCNRETGACDRCKTLYYGPVCKDTCNSTCYNPNNGSSVCDKQTGNCSFECSASQCGVQSGQESAAKSDNNGAIIGAATGSVIFVLIVVILVTVFIVMRRKRQKTSNPEPDGMEGNTGFVYSLPEKSRSSRKVESTALYVIPEKSTTVQPNSSNPAIYENGVYSNVEDRPSLPTIETVDATEDGLEEINQDDIDSGSLADNVYSMLDRADQDYITDYTTLNELAGQLQEIQAIPSPTTDVQKATYVNTDDISTGPAKDSYENVMALRE